MKTTRVLQSMAARLTMILALVVAGLATVPMSAMADHHHDDRVEARRLLQRGEIFPLSRILKIVQKRVPGDVIEVELKHSDHHGWEYKVKVLSANGRVREVKLNAGNGVVRKIEDD